MNNTILKTSESASLQFSLLLITATLLLGSCEQRKTVQKTPIKAINNQLQALSKTLTTLEINDDLQTFLAHYTSDAISMPDYQPTLDGMNEIQTFYKEIFQRQNIKKYIRIPDEFIHLDSTIIEIGTFTKEFTEKDSESILIQNGKYWNVWTIEPAGQYKIKGEAFGYFHPIEHPERLVVNTEKPSNQFLGKNTDQKIPLELQAYNALMENGVRNRDGILRSEIFTEDARFMPFADSTKAGMEVLKPYLIAYNSGQVVIDTIAVSTSHYEYLADHVLEYSKFLVKWRVPELVGTTTGNGIRIWKRQPDHSLKIHREISIHNYP